MQKLTKFLKTSVVHHIPHPEQEVTGKKSECVSSMGACWSLIVSLFLVRGWLLFIERGGAKKRGYLKNLMYLWNNLYYSCTKYPLGLQFYNSNKASEMAQIMKEIQDRYVPVAQVDGKTKIVQKVVFDGDQLTEERARNAQYANVLADNDIDRLNGIETSFGD